MELVINATRNMSIENVKAALVTTSLTKEQMKLVLMSHGVAEAEAEQMAATLAQSAANVTATTTTKGLTAATTGLKTAAKGLFATLKSNPWILVIAGIAVAVSELIKYKDSVEEAKQAAKEAARELKDSFSADFSKISGDLSTLKGLKDVEQQNIAVLNNELASLTQSFSEAMASGEIEEGSEAW